MPLTVIAIAQVALMTIGASVLARVALGSRFVFPHAALRCAVQIAASFLVVSTTVFVLVVFGLSGRVHLRALAHKSVETRATDFMMSSS